MTSSTRTLTDLAATVIDAEQVRVVPYDPIMRSVGYWRLPKLVDVEMPRIVVASARSTEELSSLLGATSQAGVPVTVRQGTGYLTPDVDKPEHPEALAIDISHLKGIDVNERDGYVDIGAAVTHDELNETLAPLGYAFPVSVGPVTWSSLVALNTSGQLVDANCGKPGDYVLGLTVVLPDGRVLETGARTLRRPAGPDLTRLFVGTQALFGVIARVRLRLVPRPGATAFCTAEYTSIDALGASIVDLYHQRVQRARLLDFMDDKYMRLTGHWDAPAPYMALVEIDGSSATEANERAEQMLDVMGQRASSVEMHDEGEWTEIIANRNAVFEWLDSANLVLLVGEVVDAPLGDLPRVLGAVEDFGQAVSREHPGLEAFLWGHVGSASCHPAICAPDDWSLDKYRQVAADVRSELLELKKAHGTGVGEQGLFPEHREWFTHHYGAEQAHILAQIKAVFDPEGRFNAGRLAPGR